MSNNEYEIIKTNLTVDEAIKKIESNTQLMDNEKTIIYSGLNQNIPFYGNVNDNEFKIHTSSSPISHQFMSLKGKVFSEEDVTKIKFTKTGISKLTVFISFIASINIIVVMMIAYYMSEGLPVNYPVFVVLFAVVGVPAIIFLNSWILTKRAVDDLNEIFDD